MGDAVPEPVQSHLRVIAPVHHRVDDRPGEAPQTVDRLPQQVMTRGAVRWQPDVALLAELVLLRERMVRVRPPSRMNVTRSSPAFKEAEESFWLVPAAT